MDKYLIVEKCQTLKYETGLITKLVITKVVNEKILNIRMVNIKVIAWALAECWMPNFILSIWNIIVSFVCRRQILLKCFQHEKKKKKKEITNDWGNIIQIMVVWNWMLVCVPHMLVILLVIIRVS